MAAAPLLQVVQIFKNGHVKQKAVAMPPLFVSS
jgi:hypothetical protein